MEPKPLIVILGPTASGKSDLAMKLARYFNGELICADSRTVYRYMDIGTAKPKVHERKEIKHHILDVINPDEAYSAAQFKQQALEAIDSIEAAAKVPIVVGGTGLYIDSLIYDFTFLPPGNVDLRQELERLSVEALQDKIKKEQIRMPENSKNKRHLIRAIETNGAVPIKKGIRKNTLIIGLGPSREVIKQRIKNRIDEMLTEGLLNEVEELAKVYAWNDPGMLCPAYKALRGYIEGVKTLDQAKADFATNDFQYAKRQMTWFRRNEHINWVEDADNAIKLVQNFLQQKT